MIINTCHYLITTFLCTFSWWVSLLLLFYKERNSNTKFVNCPQKRWLTVFCKTHRLRVGFSFCLKDILDYLSFIYTDWLIILIVVARKLAISWKTSSQSDFCNDSVIYCLKIKSCLKVKYQIFHRLNRRLKHNLSSTSDLFFQAYFLLTLRTIFAPKAGRKHRIRIAAQSIVSPFLFDGHFRGSLWIYQM